MFPVTFWFPVNFDYSTKSTGSTKVKRTRRKIKKTKKKKKKKEIATRIDIVLELTEIVMNYYII